MLRILVVDPDRQTRTFLKVSLAASGYSVVEAETGGQGIDVFCDSHPDLVLLELCLPDVDGREIISTIESIRRTPLIVVSAKGEENDIIDALDCGACGYLTKPARIGELAARIRAAFRRYLEKPSQRIFLPGSVCIDLVQSVVTKDCQPIVLSLTEYRLLRILAINADHVMTHEQIMAAIWKHPGSRSIQYLRAYIRQLREKLETNPSTPAALLTEPRVGYRLKTQGAC